MRTDFTGSFGGSTFSASPAFSDPGSPPSSGVPGSFPSFNLENAPSGVIPLLFNASHASDGPQLGSMGIPYLIQSPKGNLVFLDTPEEEQRRIFLDLIKDEMKWQDEIKQDGRCQIPDGNGGVKRCPCRIPNPNYVEGGDAPKTIPVKCEGCMYDSFRQAHTTVPFSTLEYEDEDGETESYEAMTPSNYYEADHYERICDDFLDYVQEHNASLTGLADLLIREYSRSEAARKLGIAVSTAGSRKEQLKELCRNFLDSTISF